MTIAGRLRAIPIVWIAVAGVTSGCGDHESPAAPELGETVISASIVADWPQERLAIRRLGKAVAMALADDDVRTAYLAAARQSPWTQHQVRLQEFVETAAGAAVLAAGASASGQHVASLRAEVDILPPFALLLSRNDRGTFSPSQALRVVTALDSEHGPYYVFDSVGNEITVEILPDAWSVITIFPEEGRTPRPVGSDRMTSHEALPVKSYAGAAGSSFAAAMIPSGSKQLDSIIYTFCDDPYGNVEIRVKAYFYGEDGTFAGSGEYYDGDAPVYSTHTMCDRVLNGQELELNPGADLIQHAIPNGGAHWVRVELWEDDCDCFGNNDDFFGSWIWRHGDSGSLQKSQYNDTDWGPCPHNAMVDCGYSGEAGVRISWTSPAASQVVSHHVESAQDTVSLTDGDVLVYARFVDQYGYRIVRSVDGWWSTDGSVLEVDNTTARLTSMRGVVPGEEQVYFTAFNATSGTTITVIECTPPAITC